jgi:hypothetical protein
MSTSYISITIFDENDIQKNRKIVNMLVIWTGSCKNIDIKYY